MIQRIQSKERFFSSAMLKMVRLKLECGHEKIVTASHCPIWRTHCIECEKEKSA